MSKNRTSNHGGVHNVAGKGRSELHVARLDNTNIVLLSNNESLQPMMISETHR